METQNQALALEIENMKILLEVAEEILFSFTLPPDLVKKYEFIRDQTFEKVGISDTSSKIWAFQSEAYARANSKSQQGKPNVMEDEIRDINYKLKAESLRHVIAKYSQILENSIKLLQNIEERIGNITSYDECTFRPKLMTLSSPDEFSLKIADLEISSQRDPWFVLESEAERSFAVFSQKISNYEIEIFSTISKVADKYRQKSLNSQTNSDGFNNSKGRSDNSDLEEKLKAINDIYTKERKQTENKLNFLLSQGYKENDIRKIIEEKDLYVEKFNILERELFQTKTLLQDEIRKLKIANKKSTIELESQTNSEIRAMKLSHSSEFEEYKKSQIKRESELLQNLENATENHSEIVRELQVSLDNEIRINDRLMRSFADIKGILNIIYQKFNSDEDAEFNQIKEELTRIYQDFEEGDLLIKTRFLAHIIEKYNSDNNWLIERLGETQKDNERLQKIASLKDETFQSMKTNYAQTSMVLKEFAEARDKLKNKFETSLNESSKSPEKESTFTKLFQKYIGPK
ncbi:unnamed protein product [Blepharisma stoltei]|uniref:Uncharacterized protein n=1 Tax=Blepharisma stoltei TaxID=1481888 RepID=A0AAU9IEE0_9CILI|nr:unnamed protein product [Blepharisma stoltei]